MKPKVSQKKVDKIDTIRTLLLKRIEFHSQVLDDLRRKLKQAEDVEAMLPELAEIDGVSLADPVQGEPYSALGLTEAVKKSLNRTIAEPKTLRELHEILIHGGYKPTRNSQFLASLNATLYRLAKDGLVIVAENADGLKTYMKRLPGA